MPKTNRDDFSKETVLRAAQRTAFRCSFCRMPTIGPSREANNAVSNIGVAAHICAAAPRGKRYDPNMTKVSYFNIIFTSRQGLHRGM